MWHRERLRVLWKYLNADVVRACELMSAKPIDNSSHITPGDDGIDQPVTATVHDVRVTEAEATQVIHIVRLREVPGDMPRAISRAFAACCRRQSVGLHLLRPDFVVLAVALLLSFHGSRLQASFGLAGMDLSGVSPVCANPFDHD